MPGSTDKRDPLYRLTKAQLVAEVNRLREQAQGDCLRGQAQGGESSGELPPHGDRALEDSLHASESRFRTLVEHSIQGIIVHRTFEPLFANQAFADIFGFADPHEVLVQQDLFSILLPEDRARLHGIARDALEGGKVPRVHRFRAQRRSGERLMLETLNTVIDWEGERAILAFVLDITQRHKAEEELRASQHMLAAVIDTVPHWIFVKDADGRYIMVNRSMARDLGRKVEDFIGRRYADMAVNPDHEHIRSSERSDRDVLGGRQEMDEREVMTPHHDGRNHYRRILKLPIRGESGAVSCLVGISEDVTHQHKHVVELEGSEERFRNLVEGSIQGVLIRNRERLLFANKTVARIFGFDSPEELLELESLESLVAPEDRERMSGYARDRLQGKEVPATYTFQGLRKDGRRIWLDATARPVEWMGEPAIQLINVDITDRVEAERELRKNRALLQTMIDTIPVWLHVKDSEGRYVFINRKMASELGVQPEAMVGLLHEEAPHGKPEERRRIRENDQRVLDTGRMLQAEESVTMPDGHVRTHKVYKAPLRDQDGNIVGILGTSEDITARKLAEEEIRTHRDNLRLVTDSLPINIAHWDREERYLLANRTVCTWYGRTPSQVIGATVREMLGEESYARVAGYMARALAGEEVQFETPIVYPDGKERVMAFTYVPDRADDGTVRGGFALGLDMTDRRRADEDLRDSQRLLQTVFDTIPHALYVKDRQGRYRMVNQTALQAEDTFLSDLPGLSAPPTAATVPEHLEKLEALDNEVLKTGRRVERPEMPVWLLDGTRRVLHLIKLPLSDEAGQVDGLVSIAQDITARVQAESALKEYEERFRLIADHSPSAISLKDPEGRFQLVNTRISEWAGRSPEDIIGKTSLEVFPFDNPEMLLEQDLQVSRTGRAAEFEFTITTAAGAVLRVTSTKFPVFDANGGVAGVGTITTDVSEQRAAEEHLRQTQRLEALGTLAGGIAHDLNNILFPILGYTEVLLKQYRENPETNSFLEIISSSATRAKDLVSQILLFSRAVEGQRDLCMLKPIAQEVAKLIRSTISAAIHIEMHIMSALPLVRADPSQMHQVMMNLCINAAQAMPGGGELHLSLERVEVLNLDSYAGHRLNGVFVCFTCKDTGVGMDETTLNRIFEPFFSTRGVGEGTGLGLATVYGIVQQHGGGVRVESNPGEGSRFEVYLPAVEEEVVSRTMIQDAPLGGKESILFVDDETTITTFVKLALEECGFRVTTYNDPHKALTTFLQNPQAFDLVITDQAMPSLTGDRLAVELLKINPAVPIVLATGNGDSLDPRVLRGLGIQDFLYKPLGSDELVRFIREVLDRPRAG